MRESLERAELQKLQSIAAAMARTRDEIESLEKDMDAAQRRMFNTVVATGATGAELHFEMTREAAFTMLRAELLKKLAELEQKVKEQQARYFQARMQREILSNLYKRQRAEYELAESRREQQRIDELFLIRRVSSSR